MKLNVDVLKKNKNLLKKFYSKEDQSTSSLYFDFESEYVYLKDNKGSIAKIKFSLILDTDEVKPENIMINSSTFIALIDKYPEFEIIEETTTSLSLQSGDDKFKLQAIPDGDYFNTDLFNIDVAGHNKIVITTEIKEMIDKAINYTSPNSEFLVSQCILITKGYIFSIINNQFYEAKIDIDTDFILNPIHLNYNILLKEDTEIYFQHDANYSYISTVDGVEMLIPVIENPVIPGIRSDAFVDKYKDHTEYIEVNTSEFIETMKFMSIFFSRSINNKGHISFDKDKLSLSTIGVEDMIDNTIALTANTVGSYFEFNVDMAKLRQAVETLKTKTVRFYIVEDKAMINIKETDNDDEHIIIVRMGDED